MLCNSFVLYVLYNLFSLSQLFQRYVSILDWENETLWSPKYYVSLTCHYIYNYRATITVFICVFHSTFIMVSGFVKSQLGLEVPIFCFEPFDL